MRVLGLVFSARSDGNSHDCISYCIQQLDEKSIETRVIELSGRKILPCSSCKYECFSERIRGTVESCPIKDDLPEIYKEFEDADVVIFGIPTYVGHVPAIYRAWEERGLGIYGLDTLYQKLGGKIYGFIVIGDTSALNEAIHRFHSNPLVTWILLKSREYGLDPLKRGLIEIPDVKNRLDVFVKTLMRFVTEKKT